MGDAVAIDLEAFCIAKIEIAQVAGGSRSSAFSSAHSSVLDESSTDCYPRGPCNDGYMDMTNGNYQYWGCGSNCPGGTHYTTGDCTCACIADAACSERFPEMYHALLSRDNDGPWGSWLGAEFCPEGQYARGFRIRSEWPVGNGDDTAANAVKLYCSSPGWSYDNQYCASAGDPTCTMVGNFEGYWGEWCGSGAQCPSGEFVVGFDQKVEGKQGYGIDDTALNDIAALCSDGTVIKPACNQAEYGKWGSFTRITHTEIRKSTIW